MGSVAEAPPLAGPWMMTELAVAVALEMFAARSPPGAPIAALMVAASKAQVPPESDKSPMLSPAVPSVSKVTLTESPGSKPVAVTVHCSVTAATPSVTALAVTSPPSA